MQLRDTNFTNLAGRRMLGNSLWLKVGRSRFAESDLTQGGVLGLAGSGLLSVIPTKGNKSAGENEIRRLLSLKETASWARTNEPRVC